MQIKEPWKALWVLLVLAVAVGCKKSSDESPATSKSSESNRQSSDYFQTQFQDESQFIVETIVSDLAEQVFYAKHRQLPDSSRFSVRAAEKPDSPFGAPIYELKITLSDQLVLSPELNVNGPIWSPEIYKGVVADLAKAVGLEASPTNGNGAQICCWR